MGQVARGRTTPRARIAAECARRGRADVVAGCIELLRGGDADATLIHTLGGASSDWVVTGDASGPDYWLRVWAARGLLWAWDDAALEAVGQALDDEQWRAREMALKVVARHRLHDVVAKVADLQDDSVPRVRSAAARALVRLSKGSPEVRGTGG